MYLHISQTSTVKRDLIKQAKCPEYILVYSEFLDVCIIRPAIK